MNTPYNLIFGISAVTFNLLVAGVFIATRHEKMQTVRKLGVIMIALGIPFSAVLIHVLNNGSNQNVSIALAVVLVYLLAELLLDFIFNYDFRSRFVTHFPYILLEYGAFIGLIYTAFDISAGWGWVVSITFWVAMIALIYYFAGMKKNKNKG